jgi:alkylated DNA repair dioxygenase AlkB
MAVQMALWGREQPRVDWTFGGIQRIPLGLGSWVDRLPGWLRGHEQVFEAVRSGTHWKTTSQILYDREVTTPRLVARYPDDGPWLPLFDEIAGALSERYATPFESVHSAYYRDGRDSVAWHRDRDGRERTESLTAIVSVGEPRPFTLRPYKRGRSTKLTAGWGDLLVMGGRCQLDFEHAVPKVKHAGPRISLMFRHEQPVGALAPE